MNKSVELFDGSRLWKRYQRLFESIRETGSQRKLDALESKTDSLSPDVSSALGNSPLVAALEQVLRCEIERRRDELDTPRGEPEEPDALLILRGALPRLAADRQIVEALRAAGVDHAWAVETFSTSLAQSVATVEDQAKLVRAAGRIAPGQGELAQAEAELAPARATLEQVRGRP